MIHGVPLSPSGRGAETLWGGGVVSCVGGGVNIPHHHAHKKGDWVGLYAT